MITPLVKLVTAAAILLLLWFVVVPKVDEWRGRNYDEKADTLKAATGAATGALLTADTVWLAGETRWLQARGRVDTLRLPGEARAAIRACDALVVSCRVRAERADSLVSALRRELDHAQKPRPKPRVGYYGDGVYDPFKGAAAVRLGSEARLFGGVHALLEAGVEQAAPGVQTSFRAGIRIRF